MLYLVVKDRHNKGGYKDTRSFRAREYTETYTSFEWARTIAKISITLRSHNINANMTLIIHVSGKGHVIYCVPTALRATS